MPNFARTLTVVGITFALSSCASPAKLARQSNEALAKGDLRTAYDRAERAVEKDPQNQAARDAYNAASGRVSVDYRMRVVAGAAADTLAAANLALEYRRFRVDVARRGTALDADSDYDRAEAAILRGAAGIHYRRGADAMSARRPKVAVTEFAATRRYDDNYADVASRMTAARREATVRVALLPFVDRTGVPGLSQEIADTVQRELGARAASNFRYTQIVPAGELERNMTVSEMRNMRFEDAVDIGRRIGADWVVVGRFRDFRAKESRRSGKVTLFHRIEIKDRNNVTVVRWEEITVPVAMRQRDVSVLFEFDVIDAGSGAVLAHREQAVEAVAHVTWTDFRAEEHDDRYALLPPDERRADPRRAREVDAAWREQMGSWDVRDFVRHSRDERGRSRYSPRYRGEFYSDTRGRPVWLGELPGENELAFVALHDVWRVVLAELKGLDEKD